MRGGVGGGDESQKPIFTLDEDQTIYLLLLSGLEVN